MIRLGFCLDLTEPKNVESIRTAYGDFKVAVELSGDPLPKNTRKYRKLDSAVFEYAYKALEESGPNSKVDAAQGVSVPAGGDKPVWEGSWISRAAHIQVCVRNPANLLGTWLHHPTSLGVGDVCEAFQAGHAGIDPDDPEGEEDAEGDADAEED